MADALKQITRTADGVFAIDPEGRIILWNPSAQKILEYTPESAFRRRFSWRACFWAGGSKE